MKTLAPTNPARYLRQGQSCWRPAIRTSPRAYAHRTLVNLSRNRWRDLGRRPRVEQLATELGPSPDEDGHEVVLDRLALTEALREQPQPQREVSVLRFVVDLSVAETAAALGIAEGTVKSTTSIALASLRNALSDHREPTNARGTSC